MKALQQSSHHKYCHQYLFKHSYSNHTEYRIKYIKLHIIISNNIHQIQMKNWNNIQYPYHCLKIKTTLIRNSFINLFLPFLSSFIFWSFSPHLFPYKLFSIRSKLYTWYIFVFCLYWEAHFCLEFDNWKLNMSLNVKETLIYALSINKYFAMTFQCCLINALYPNVNVYQLVPIPFTWPLSKKQRLNNSTAQHKASNTSIITSSTSTKPEIIVDINSWKAQNHE